MNILYKNLCCWHEQNKWSCCDQAHRSFKAKEEEEEKEGEGEGEGEEIIPQIWV